MKHLALVALALALTVLAGCGGGSSADSRSRPQLIVSAASSLRNAFADYGQQFKAAKVRLSFGGSDELAAQIRAGGRADVYAAADTKLPDQLYAEGKVMKPVPFTANRLVLGVPKNSNVRSLADLTKPGVKLAIGAASVPVGSYTRKVLGGLPPVERDRILANVKTEEPDVAGIVGKLTQGAVNAGFVYITDVTATKGALRAIALPERLRPTVTYEAAVVKASRHPQQARAFIDGLVHGEGHVALAHDGFLPLR
jgi:molybdate transport system substrate-binding protein